MKSFIVNINSIEKVKSFVNTIAKLDGDYDLVSERYVVDAKSIMGIFSLDISQDLRLDIHDEANYEAAKLELKQFIVE